MKLTSIGVGVLTGFLFFAGKTNAQDTPAYTQFLTRIEPAEGAIAPVNTPVLRWPYQKGKQVRYAIRLSADASFPAGTTETVTGLTGAVYNPHRLLNPGTWYWSYQVLDKSGKITGKWSDTHSFRITGTSIRIVSPPAEVFLSHIPAGHSRILAFPAGLTAQSLRNDPAAGVIIEEADAAAKTPVLKEAEAASAVINRDNKEQAKKVEQDALVKLGNTVHEHIVALCEAYMLTGDKKYAAPAIAQAMELAKWDPEGASGTSDFMDGITMYNMALVYDCFFEQMTQEEAATLLNAAKRRANRFYHAWVNNIESKVLSGHVWQLIMNEVFKTGLAFYKYDPDAEKWLSYIYETFLAREPLLGGMDGGWAEGASYFQMNMETLIEIPLYIHAYTGFDFIQAHPWYRQQADWLMYHVPPGSMADGFGDNTEEVIRPTATYALFADVMARLTKDSLYSWYHDQLMRLQHPDVLHTLRLRWTDMLVRHTHTYPPAPAQLQLPLAKLSEQSGVVAMHTNLAHPSEDLMLAIRSSPFGAYGHILADQNTFNIIYRGTPLFFRTGYKVAMNDPHRQLWSKHTRSQNGVLINDAGEPYSIEAGGRITRFLQNRDMVYVKGDASGAYASRETKENAGMTKFLRHWVLLKDAGIILVYDELSAKEPADWSWLIHSLQHMKIDKANQTFTATIPEGKGRGKLWASAPVKWSLVDTFLVPAISFRQREKALSYNNNQWHLTVSSQQKQDNMRYFCLIQVRPDGKFLSIASKEENGRLDLTVGGWHISVNLSVALKPALDIQSISGKTAFSAYDGAVVMNGKQYGVSTAGYSVLAENRNGKVVTEQTGEGKK